MHSQPSQATSGALFALVAYLIWGLVPVYWKWVDAVPAGELLAHRVLWSALLGVLLVAATRNGNALMRVFRTPALLPRILFTALLIGVNWLTFVWAVLHDQIVATSLGYYITPLVHVSLGVLVLKERLRPLQAGAIALATVGIAQLAIAVGSLPWVTLVLAFSFGFYGLLRKMAPIEPIVGFAVETISLLAIALPYLAWLAAQGTARVPTGDIGFDLVITASGLITAAPLITFNAAARRLNLTTLGFFQYIAPSISFVVAITLYDEPFGRRDAITFGCVWAALLLYSVDSLRAVGYRSSPA